MGRSTLVVVALASLWASTVRASDLALEWTAPHGCPTQDALREGLSTRVGRKVQRRKLRLGYSSMRTITPDCNFQGIE